jgi:D-alanine-D-alanine ligase
MVMSLTLHKGMTKRVIRDAGVPTSISTWPKPPKTPMRWILHRALFRKPVAEGTGKGVTPESIVRRKTDLEIQCRRLIDAFHQPVIIEPYLPGREFTAGIVGTGAHARVLGTIEVHLLDTAEQGVYSYVNKEECESRVLYRLVRPEDDPVVAEAEAVALAAWRALGCRDAGRLDLRCDAGGQPLFIEVNPLAGIHPEHSDLPIICNHLGIPYRDLIGWIIASAATRVEQPHSLRGAA